MQDQAGIASGSGDPGPPPAPPPLPPPGSLPATPPPSTTSSRSRSGSGRTPTTTTSSPGSSSAGCSPSPSSQSDLEANLFKLMEKRGYGEDYTNRYKMMTRFHHQRVALVILVCGTACTGKSTIATQLAQRLNLPNVLQTDMVYELLRTSTDAPLTSVSVWARDFSSPEELITELCRECRVVRKGLAGDLKKAMKDGKPIIIEHGVQMPVGLDIIERKL